MKQWVLAAVGLFLKKRRVEDWPSWAADLFDIKLPSNANVKDEISAYGGANINIILDLLHECESTPGNIAECGVYRGSTLISMALYLRQIGSGKKLFGFDSFEGFDADIKKDLELGGVFDNEKRVGGFGNTSQNLVQGKADALSLDNLQLVCGYFKDTFEKFPEMNFSFVHLDCDGFESYRTCLDYFFPRLNDGGIILFDEYNDPPWPGCNLAVDEFLAKTRLELHSIVRDGHQKYFIRKGGYTGVQAVESI